MKAPKLRQVVFKGEDITHLVESVIVPDPKPSLLVYSSSAEFIRKLHNPDAKINYISGKVDYVPPPYTGLSVVYEY